MAYLITIRNRIRGKYMADKKKKELTVQQKERIDRFDQLRRILSENGYKETIITMSALRANIMAMVITVPIVIVCLIVYMMIRIGSQGVVEIPGLFLVLLFVGIVIHELIHGLTWAFYSKKKWKAIRFGVIWKYVSPYCTCDECLSYKAYLLGGIMPTIVLGIIPYVISLFTGNFLLFMFAICLIMGGGGDIYIMLLIRKYKNAIFIDHPNLIGCVVFEKI